VEATFLFGEMLAPLDANVPINSVLLNVNQAKRARCPDAGSCCNVAFRRFRADHDNASHMDW